MAVEFSLRIEREMSASPEEIFEAFADADLMGQWWCPPGHRVRDAEVDLRVGGRYRIVASNLQTSNQITIGGEFLTIDRPTRLIFTHTFGGDAETLPPGIQDLLGHEAVVTITLSKREGSTLLTLAEDKIASARGRDLLQNGWPRILENLAKLGQCSRLGASPN